MLSTFSCTEQEPEYPEISLTQNTLSMIVGETDKIGIEGGSGEFQAVSLDKNIVSVALPEKGTEIQITAVASGETEIVVTDIKTKMECRITVHVYDSSELTQEDVLMTVGEKTSVEIKGGSGKFTAESEQEDVASVSVQDGMSVIQIEAKAAGRTVVTVTDNELQQKHRMMVKVYDPVKLSEDNVNLETGASANIYIEKGSGDYVVDASGVEGIAFVQYDHNIIMLTAKKVGEGSLKVKDNVTGNECEMKLSVLTAPSVSFHTKLKLQWFTIIMDAPKEVQDRIWIDLNGDAEMQENEKVKTFGVPVGYPQNDNITIYGPITVLNISKLNIETVDVSKNPYLENLDVSINMISEIDLSSNKALKMLNVSNNRFLKSLDVTKLDKLEELTCCAIPITSLDVSGNPELKTLHCIQTQVKSINLGTISKIEKLNIWNNYIEEIDLSRLTGLTFLSVCNNQLKSLDLSNNPNIEVLNISRLSIENMDLSANKELVDLYAGECGFTDVNFLKTIPNPEKLKTLDLSMNYKLTSIDLSSFTSLTLVKFFQCSIGEEAMMKIAEDLPMREMADDAQAFIIDRCRMPWIKSKENNKYNQEIIDLLNSKNWTPYDQNTGAGPIPMR